MSEPGDEFDLVLRILQLWKELERTKPNTYEYNALVQKIRALSAAHQDLIDASKKKPGNSE